MTRTPTRASALPLARILDHAPTSASALLRVLDRARAINLDYALVLVLNRARARARDLTRTLDRDRALALDLHTHIHLDHALDNALDLVLDLERDFALARTLDRDLTRALDRDRNLPISLDLVLKRFHELSQTLMASLEAACQYAHDVAEALSKPEPAQTKELTPPSTPTAFWPRRLTRWAVRALPALHRADYQEIFDSELHDLATEGCSRRVQITHALRVLLHTPRLRRDLRAPGPPAAERSRQ